MGLGIPYMGSKRKLASEILHFITSRHPTLTDFYDLFGGGGSISFTAVQDYRFPVHYNELNPHIYSLVEYLKTNKTLEQKFYEWVTREEFFKQCSRQDADWYSGFVMSCWSFGNKQCSYIYGADIEELKRLAHQFVVFGDLEAMEALNIDLAGLLAVKDMQKRRVLFCKHIEKLLTTRFDLQNLESLQYIESLSRLQNLQNLQITNKSYENVVITGNDPVIYCDIPYKGTKEYKESGFDHERFYEWANDCPYPVYISEYSTPFKEVHAFRHRSSLSATNNKKQTIEKIFYNGQGVFAKTKLF
jgi:site-specific DNA-adenine methylase